MYIYIVTEQAVKPTDSQKKKKTPIQSKSLNQKPQIPKSEITKG